MRVILNRLPKDERGKVIGFNRLQKEMNKIIGKNKGKEASPIDVACKFRHLQVVNLLIDGYSVDEIKEELIEAGYSEKRANYYLRRACDLMKKEYAELIERAANDNMKRLHQVIVEAAEDGDRQTVLKAIDIQNKMANLYTEKIKLQAENDIKISFGE